jgi:phosphate acetyltransferase
MELLDTLEKRARDLGKRIAFPESWDTRVKDAARVIKQKGICEPVLIGGPEEDAGDRGVGEWIAPESEEILKLHEIHSKAVGSEQPDNLTAALLLLSAGKVDGVVSGACTSTADVARCALKIIGTRDGVSLLSSCFLMQLPESSPVGNKIVLYADAGVVPDPSARALAEIALVTAGTMRTILNAEPVVAMLSFSTKGSATHRTVKKVIEATEIAKRMSPGLIIDGELQGDAALVPEVCEKKAPGSPVEGRANVLIFPDLNSANIAYKLTERLAGAVALGPIFQGLRKPVNDLSRGCNATDIVYVAAVTALQAGCITDE